MSTPRGATLGPVRDVVGRTFHPVTDPKTGIKYQGLEVENTLSCGHVVDVRNLHTGKTRRMCATCGSEERLKAAAAREEAEKHPCEALISALSERKIRACGRPAVTFKKGKWRCQKCAPKVAA